MACCPVRSPAGHGMCGPTVGWANENWKEQLLPPLASGEDIWCQLFSNRRADRTLRACAPVRSRRMTGRATGSSTAEDLDQRRPAFRLGALDHPHRPERGQAQGPDHVLPAHGFARR